MTSYILESILQISAMWPCLFVPTLCRHLTAINSYSQSRGVTRQYQKKYFLKKLLKKTSPLLVEL